MLEGNVRRLFLEMDIGPTKVVHQEVENEVENEGFLLGDQSDNDGKVI